VASASMNSYKRSSNVFTGCVNYQPPATQAPWLGLLFLDLQGLDLDYYLILHLGRGQRS
jgi:hypothetical protein